MTTSRQVGTQLPASGLEHGTEHPEGWSPLKIRCPCFCKQGKVEVGPIFSADWTPHEPFFSDMYRYHWICTWSALFRTCQAPGLAAKVNPIAHFGHFRSRPAISMLKQINSKIFAIGKCHSAIASIFELLSTLVWFTYQIIPFQSLLYTCDTIFCSQNITRSASDRCHLGSESGMTNWLWLKAAVQKCSERETFSYCGIWFITYSSRYMHGAGV